MFFTGIYIKKWDNTKFTGGSETKNKSVWAKNKTQNDTTGILKVNIWSKKYDRIEYSSII